MSDGLSVSYSDAASDKERSSYRRILGGVLVLDALMGLALVIAPGRTMRLLQVGDPASADWARIAGLLAVIVAALLWTGWHHPNRAKLVNSIAIASRFLFGVALMLIGGRLLWIGLFEAVAALVLLRFYYRFFAAMVMSRP
jgi:CHASE2 domain-containing sensor protein